jgi:hypothetical protein
MSRSSRNYLQRLGLEPTIRRPLPTTAPDALIIHRQPVRPPLPHPTLLLPAQGAPPPDRGRTEAWPHGSDGEQSPQS